MKFIKRNKFSIWHLVITMGIIIILLGFASLITLSIIEAQVCKEKLGYIDTSVHFPTPYNWLIIPGAVAPFVGLALFFWGFYNID